MSKTAKITAVGIMIAGTFAAAGNAQQMQSSFFQELTSSKNTPASVAPVAQDPLLNVFEHMIKDVSTSKSTSATSAPITIEEIDRQNRESVQRANQIKLQELKYREMKAQIDMLVTLDGAKREIESARQAEAQARALITPVEVTEVKQSKPAADFDNKDAGLTSMPEAPDVTQLMNAEKASMPRLVEIFGSGGVLSATTETPSGAQQTVSVGKIISGGFSVEDITPEGISVRGLNSGMTYFLIPNSRTPVATQLNPTQTTPSDARKPIASMGGMSIF